MSSAMYDAAVETFVRGELDWVGDTVKVMLVTGDYRPSQARDATRADLRGFEANGGGSYRAGGLKLSGRSLVRGEVGGEVRLDGGSVEWEGFTGQFRYAVVYHARGEASADRLIAYSDLGRQEATNARVTIAYDSGVAEFSAVAGG